MLQSMVEICQPLSKLIVFAKFPKNGYRFWGRGRGPFAIHGFVKERKGRGTESKRKGNEEERITNEKGKEKERKRKWNGRGKEEERRRKEEERQGGQGPFVVWGYLLFEQMGIAKVSLGVSLISSLACRQLCANKRQVWTVCTIIGIAFGGPIATRCLAHFPDT